jgi:hypothetical protein
MQKERTNTIQEEIEDQNWEKEKPKWCLHLKHDNYQMMKTQPNDPGAIDSIATPWKHHHHSLTSPNPTQPNPTQPNPTQPNAT